MRIVGPSSYTVGTPTSVDDPAQGGGNPSIACQIQNASSYQLLVNAGGAPLTIQPFFAQTFSISGQPISITPITGTSTGTASNITLAFLLEAPPQSGVQVSDGSWVEQPPIVDGSLTAEAIASLAGVLTTQGLMDALGFFPMTLQVQTVQYTALNSYTALHVLAYGIGTPTGGAIPLCVAVQDFIPPPTNATGPIFGAAVMQQVALDSNVWQATIPFSCKVGDDINVTVLFSSAPGAGAGVRLFGSTALQTSVQMRTDGRAYPIGCFSASAATTAGGSATLIPAFSATIPGRVLLQTLQANSSAGPWVVRATINGTTVTLSQAGPQGAFALPIPPQGILCDPNTAVTLLGNGSTIQGAQCTYDIVL